MAHELDITNGQASFVSAREHAWHRLGRVLDDAFTAEEAMTQGLLGGWDVRKQPLFAAEGGDMIPVPGFVSVVRTNPVTFDPEPLGIVSPRYQPIQNEEHAAFLNNLVDESGAHFETAGALYGGRQVFISMKLPGHIRIGGADNVETYITALNSHDGSSSFTIMVTPIRVVCANTLGMALRSRPNMFRIRHTSGALTNLQKARDALEFTFDYMDDFQEEANKLVDTTLTHGAFMEMMEKEFGAGKGASQNLQTRRQEKLDILEELFVEAGTQAPIRDTAWAGFNAVAEYLDHYSPRYGDDPDTSRATSAVLEQDAKTQMWNKMLAFAA